MTTSNIKHLFIEGLSMATTGTDNSPYVIAIIDVNKVFAAAQVLHQRRSVLSSVTVTCGYAVGDNPSEDSFHAGKAWIEINSFNDDGTPNFGMFHLREKFSDIVHSKGLNFNEENFGEWLTALIKEEDGKQVAYVVMPNNSCIQRMRFYEDGDKFYTDPEDPLHVRKVTKMTTTLAAQLGLTPETAQSEYDCFVK